MELPQRTRGDELLAPGEMMDIRRRLRRMAAEHDLTTVIAYAFDWRTRMLPFIYADRRMAPAGVRAVGSVLADCGFTKTRIVLQQWNKNFRPSRMRLDGKIPDIFMVSSMHLHSAQCDRLIEDACRIDPAHRPLIIAGGPKAIYDPWEVFSADPENPWGADVAVTGEEYVVLALLEVLLSMRANGEPLRNTFLRARDGGALDAIPGLVYAQTDRQGRPQQLVDTGIQRLLGDLDELPSPVLGFDMLEPPSRSQTLGPHALKGRQVRKYSPVASMVLTFGCKFRCSYCPIPAYNQRQFRAKSGERIADEIQQLFNNFGIGMYFGADDNFFNDHKRVVEIGEALARRVDAGSRAHCKARWATEVTVHDTVKLQEHLPLMRKAGLWAVWMGVEDITASLVRKGQSEDKTLEAFRLLRANGIFPIPMMMHHDEQPLVTRKSNYGLLNQLRLLRKAGAVYTQVLMLVPARGSKFYEDTYTSGLAFDRVNGVEITPQISDGNYVVASRHPRPWIKQLNILMGYIYFFNPLRFLYAFVRPKSKIPLADAETAPPQEVARRSRWKQFRCRVKRKLTAHLIDATVQLAGMLGLLQTFRRTFPWCGHLLRGKIRRHTRAPASRLPMTGVQGKPASHAIPGTPQPSTPSQLVSLDILPAKSCCDSASDCGDDSCCEKSAENKAA